MAITTSATLKKKNRFKFLTKNEFDTLDEDAILDDVVYIITGNRALPTLTSGYWEWSTISGYLKNDGWMKSSVKTSGSYRMFNILTNVETTYTPT